MDPPIVCIQACVLDWVTAVQHRIVADIDPDMARPVRVIRSLEEYEVSRLSLTWGYDRTHLPQFLSR